MKGSVALRARIVCAVAVLVMLGACARPPKPGQPISPAELEELISAIGADLNAPSSLRGSGTSELSIGGRTYRFSFALLYSRPGWIRFDLRPDVGGIGATLTALSVLEDDCAVTYLPGRAVVIDGCLSDLVEQIPSRLDAASLIAGVPDVSFALDLEAPMMSRGPRGVVLTGEYAGSHVLVELAQSEPRIDRLVIGSQDGETSVTVRYSEHAVMGGTSVPRLVEIELVNEAGRDAKASISYSRRKPGADVDRDQYELSVPTEVRSLSWHELGLAR